jgi:hypothetical protein
VLTVSIIGVMSPDEGGSKYLWNVSNLTPDYMVQTSQKTAIFIVIAMRIEVSQVISLLWTQCKCLFNIILLETLDVPHIWFALSIWSISCMIYRDCPSLGKTLVRFEVLTVISVKMAVFLVGAPCRYLLTFQRSLPHPSSGFLGCCIVQYGRYLWCFKWGHPSSWESIVFKTFCVKKCVLIY